MNKLDGCMYLWQWLEKLNDKSCVSIGVFVFAIGGILGMKNVHPYPSCRGMGEQLSVSRELTAVPMSGIFHSRYHAKMGWKTIQSTSN